MEGRLLSRIVQLIGIAYLQTCAADKLAPDYVPAHHGAHGQFAHTEETYTPTTDYQEYYNYNQGKEILTPNEICIWLAKKKMNLQDAG